MNPVYVLTVMLHDLATGPRAAVVEAEACQLCSLFLADLEKLDSARAEHYRRLLAESPRLRLAE